MSAHRGCASRRAPLVSVRRSIVAGLACAAVLPGAFGPAAAAPATADDEQFMRMAIEEARLADFPFGAVIVRDGPVIARGHNLGRTKGDPTAHGEMVAIRTSRRPQVLGPARHHALYLGRALRDVHGRDPVVPFRPAGVRGVGRTQGDADQPDHDLERTRCAATRRLRRSRSPAECWRTTRWRCSGR